MKLKYPHLLLAANVMLASTAASAADLIGVHDVAARNDPQLQSAAYRRDATGENKRLAWAGFLPNITGSATLTQGDSKTKVPGFPADSADNDTENYRLTINQPIYNKSNYGQLDQARAQVSQADANYQAAYQSFLLRVSERYFNVLTAIDGLAFAEAEEKALQRQFEQAEQRFDVGLTAVTDVHEARASYDNARARVIVARNTLQDAQEGLRELAGRYFEQLDPLQEELPLEEPDPADPAEWVQLAIDNDPVLLASLQAVEIADANVALQKAGHYPTLDLSASYSKFLNNEFVGRDPQTQQPLGTATLENENTNFSLQLNVPIYSGGSVSARARQAAYQYQAAQQDYEQQHRATVRATENAYRAVIAGMQQVGAFKQALVSAQSALDATQAGFDVGTRTIVDVLLAEQRFFQAQRDYSNSRHTYILDHLRLRQAAGILNQDDLRLVNQLLD